MKKSTYAVFGLGAFGSRLAVELSRAGNDVVAVDLDADRVNEIRDEVAEAVVADVSSEEVIRELNVAKFDAVILGMSSHFEALVLTLTLLRQEGAKRIFAKAGTRIQERILYRLGADEIILPEQDVAERLSRRLSLDNISDFFIFKGQAIAEVIVPEKLAGKSLRELALRNRYNITVLTIGRGGGSPETVFDPETVLETGDQLTVFGNQKSIIELFKD